MNDSNGNSLTNSTDISNAFVDFLSDNYLNESVKSDQDIETELFNTVFIGEMTDEDSISAIHFLSNSHSLGSGSKGYSEFLICFSFKNYF